MSWFKGWEEQYIVIAISVLGALIAGLAYGPEIVGFVTGPLNDVWGAGLEAALGVAAIPSLLAAAYWWWLPDYCAVVFHNGTGWLDQAGVWSTRKDHVLFAQAEAGRLFGGFVQQDQAHLPRNPKARLYRVRLWGSERGIYRVIGVRILDAGWESLAKPGRSGEAPLPVERQNFVPTPRFEFEEQDEMLSLRG